MINLCQCLKKSLGFLTNKNNDFIIEKKQKDVMYVFDSKIFI